MQKTLAQSMVKPRGGTNLDFERGGATGHLISCVKCAKILQNIRLKVLIFQSEENVSYFNESVCTKYRVLIYLLISLYNIFKADSYLIEINLTI